MKNILFVCTGNQYRSPLAAAYFQKKLHKDGMDGIFKASSAGLWVHPGQTIPNDVMALARDMELRLIDHTSQQASGNLMAQQHAILVMETGQEEALKIEFPEMADRIALLSKVVDQISYNIPDPRQSRRQLVIIARELFDLIDRGYPKILRMIDPNVVRGV